VTYQLNISLPDGTAEDVKEYARARGMSIAAAVRVLLYEALNGKDQPGSG
jgi:ribbon-helix-helix CopG family protein